MSRKGEIIEEGGKKMIVGPSGRRYPADSESLPGQVEQEILKMRPTEALQPTANDELAERMVTELLDREQINTAFGLMEGATRLMFRVNPGMAEMISNSDDPNGTYLKEVGRFIDKAVEYHVDFEKKRTKIAEENAAQAFFQGVDKALSSRFSWALAPKEIKGPTKELIEQMMPVLAVHLASQLTSEQMSLGAKNLNMASEAYVTAGAHRLTLQTRADAESSRISSAARAENKLTLARSEAEIKRMQIDSKRESSAASRESTGAYIDLFGERVSGGLKEIFKVIRSGAVDIGKTFFDADDGLLTQPADAVRGIVDKISVPIVTGAALGGGAGFMGGLGASAYLSNLIGATPEGLIIIVPVATMSIGLGALGGWLGSKLN